MDKDILKKALLLGIGSGVLTWIIYALVFKMLIDHKPANEAFFSLGSIIFMIIFAIVETVSYYFTLSKKEK
jgi:hypothetical protein